MPHHSKQNAPPSDGGTRAVCVSAATDKLAAAESAHTTTPRTHAAPTDKVGADGRAEKEAAVRIEKRLNSWWHCIMHAARIQFEQCYAHKKTPRHEGEGQKGE